MVNKAKQAEELIEKNFDQARALADRRDFFTLSLVFTVLAVAIQTFEFGEHEFQRFLEMLAWGFLFASGVSALLRVREAPVYYLAMGHREKDQWNINSLRSEVPPLYDVPGEMIRRMTPEEVEKRLEKEESNVLCMEERAKTVSERVSIQHAFHFWTLLIGLFLLGVSRAWVNLGS